MQFENLIAFSIVSGIAISFFVLLYLLRHDGIKLVSRRIAMAIQLLWITRFTLFYLKPETEPVYNAVLIMYDQTLFFLDGLLVWLYVRTLLQPDKGFRRVWLHFIPFALAFLHSTFAVLFREQQVIEQFNTNVELLKLNESNVNSGTIFMIALMIGLNLFYLARSVKITNSYNKRLKEHLSTVDHLTVDWVKTFQNLWATLFIIPLIVLFLNDIYRFTEHLSLGYFTVITFVILSVVFNYYLLEQVYRPVSLFKTDSLKNKAEQDDNKNQAFEKLKTLLEEKQYYLDDGLSLGELASYMQLKPSELTELIKYSPYENFYDLVNSYRIEAVKKELLKSNEQIIQLAYQNGFKSKSTFNKIFKEKTGMTPKTYRVSLK